MTNQNTHLSKLAILFAGFVIAFSTSADAQFVSPWTAADLEGGFSEVSSAVIGGFEIVASTEPISFDLSAGNGPMELRLTIALSTALPADAYLSIWTDVAAFAAGVNTTNLSTQSLQMQIMYFPFMPMETHQDW